LGRDRPLHPRTAAGVSADGDTLILLVVDGRQPGYSEGVATAELADWLLALGAWDGVNLDGGGTSTLAVLGEDGRPKVMNRPIHANEPGRERASGSHLGVRAPALSAAEVGETR
jgi:exopolysaccharide biosynthesis protein